MSCAGNEDTLLGRRLNEAVREVRRQESLRANRGASCITGLGITA